MQFSRRAVQYQDRRGRRAAVHGSDQDLSHGRRRREGLHRGVSSRSALILRRRLKRVYARLPTRYGAVSKDDEGGLMLRDGRLRRPPQHEAADRMRSQRPWPYETSPDRKIEIRIGERLVVEREVPPLLVVGPKAASGHRRGEQRAVLLRLIAHARVRRP